MTQIANIEVQIAGRRMPLNRVKLICEDPSLTKQSPFTDQANIKNILAKYAKTGILGDPTRTPIYGDFSQTEYTKSLNLVANIKTAFELQPVTIRQRFKNDPGEMLAFLSDEANNDEAIKLGLREKPAPPEIPTKPPTA
uniref:Scaffold protein n=1 Tax=Microviridae sp. ctMIi2 TaxID=2824993 RepID=A0A8S5R3U3_9VIRU|nr:MAG TPA: Scaffold protein [Microviridae sp. ctMIi2]